MVWFEALSDELICGEFDRCNPMEVKVAYLADISDTIKALNDGK
jgi:hypothetical protein